MDSKKNENVDLEMIQMIDEMRIEYQDTSFVRILLNHLANIKKYISFKEKGPSVFPDKQAYQSFVISCLFYNNLKSYKNESIFEKNGEPFNESFYKDYCMPRIETFHYTDDEQEMNKNRALESIKKGDILNLRVVDEQGDKFVLQILNKYKDEKRLIDCSLFAVLIKDNPLVKEIRPPLQVSDFVRAAVFGKMKQEEGVFKKLVMTLNPSFINEQELKTHLKMGRVFKKDIPFYPEDMSGFQSFGTFLDANSTFESPQKICQHMSAFRDPEKTSASLDTQDENEVPVPIAKKINVVEKIKKAEEILNKGDLTNALLEIEEVLNDYPETDKALTTRGKIYLAMAGGRLSSKTKKAMIDFEAALKINSLNKEAATFRDLVIMASIRSFSQKNMLDKANELRACLKTTDRIASAEAFLENVKRGNEALQTASNAAETGAADTDAPPIAKQEPMDV